VTRQGDAVDNKRLVAALQVFRRRLLYSDGQVTVGVKNTLWRGNLELSPGIAVPVSCQGPTRPTVATTVSPTIVTDNVSF
jgi:hypothetical protein